MELIFAVAKVSIVTLIIALPLIVLVVRRFRHGAIMMPSAGVVYTAALLPVVYLLSTVFASNREVALLGLNFNVDSFIVILLGFLAMMLTTLFSVRKSTAEKIKSWLGYLSVLVLAIFSLQVIVQAIALESMAWVYAVAPVSSWLDVAAFAGLLVIMILNIHKVNSQGEEDTTVHVKHVVGVVALMLLLGLFINVTLIFVLLGAVATFKLWSHVVGTKFNVKKMCKTSVVLLPAIVLVFSVVFTVDNTLLGAKASSSVQGLAKVSFVDIRPNWQGTLDVAKGTVATADMTAKLFGPGAGSFSEQWRVHKPFGVNSTQYWSTNFNNAIGFVPTSVITGGATAFAAWTLFLMTVAWAILRSRGSAMGLLTFFIWVFAMLNPVDILVLMVAFVITGLFVTDLARARKAQVVNYKLSGEDRNKVVAFVVLPILVVSSVGVLLVVAHRVVVNIYLMQASSAMIAGDLTKTEQLIERAAKLTDASVIEQGYTKVALANLSALLQEANVEGAEIDQEALQTALSNVLSHARKAIESDPQNPVNYVALGNISEQLIALKIENAAESALAAYAQAMALDANNPSIPYAVARIYGILEDTEQMQLALEASLKLKGNYVPALYQYGLVKMGQEEWQVAIQAFGSVVQLNQNNANALYYLSLALSREERYEEAMLVMKRVAALNPDNEDVEGLVTELEKQLTAANAAAAQADTSATAAIESEETETLTE